MKKGTVLALLVCLFLAGCNLPSTTSRTSTPDSGEIATQVQELLSTQFTPTMAATHTSISPSETPASPAEPATITPAPPVDTPPPTATISPDDPRSTLGDPTWKNNFDNGRAFGLDAPYEDDNVRITVENGRMTLQALQSTGWHSWRLTSPKVQDFYLEASVHTVQCAGDDIYGLIVRAPDFESGKGYWFGVTCGGKYSFGKWQEEGLSSIVKLTPNAAILSGENHTNRLGIRTQGSQISLYANGKLLQQLSDDTFPEAGLFGVWVAAFETGGFTIDIDEMSYWKID